MKVSALDQRGSHPTLDMLLPRTEARHLPLHEWADIFIKSVNMKHIERILARKGGEHYIAHIANNVDGSPVFATVGLMGLNQASAPRHQRIGVHMDPNFRGYSLNIVKGGGNAAEDFSQHEPQHCVARPG